MTEAEMAKAVVLKTNMGVFIMGTIQCSNGTWFNAEGCFKYCQGKTESLSKHQASKLIVNASKLGHEKKDENWYKFRENFVDIEIPVKCSQCYLGS